MWVYLFHKLVIKLDTMFYKNVIDNFSIYSY